MIYLYEPDACSSPCACIASIRSAYLLLPYSICSLSFRPIKGASIFTNITFPELCFSHLPSTARSIADPYGQEIVDRLGSARYGQEIPQPRQGPIARTLGGGNPQPQALAHHGGISQPYQAGTPHSMQREKSWVPVSTDATTTTTQQRKQWWVPVSTDATTTTTQKSFAIAAADLPRPPSNPQVYIVALRGCSPRTWLRHECSTHFYAFNGSSYLNIYATCMEGGWVGSMNGSSNVVHA